MRSKKGGGLSKSAELVYYQETNAEASAAFLRFFIAELTVHIETWLHEELGGSVLPCLGHTRGQDDLVIAYLRTVTLDQGREIEIGTGTRFAPCPAGIPPKARGRFFPPISPKRRGQVTNPK